MKWKYKVDAPRSKVMSRAGGGPSGNAGPGRPPNPGSAIARTTGPQSGPPRSGGFPPGRPMSHGPAPNRVACNICKRLFAEDRLQAHVALCRSHHNIKRQPFDSAKHRLDHVYHDKDIKRATMAKRPPKLFNVPWKDAHNNWIGAKGGGSTAGRSRSGAGQSAVGAGGAGGADDGRINCPGCGRKFNKLAAEKHIPYCTSKNR